MIYVLLFFTHSGAIKFRRFCKKNNIECDLIPVPRELSSSCGVSAKIEFDGDYKTFIDDEQIEEIYSVNNNKYTKLYSNN